VEGGHLRDQGRGRGHPHGQRAEADGADRGRGGEAAHGEVEERPGESLETSSPSFSPLFFSRLEEGLCSPALLPPPSRTEKKNKKKKVATDTRLWLARHLREETRVHLGELLRAAALRAEAEADVVMPGFTHLQPAQVVRWSHWLLSHASAWQRDAQRLGDLLPRVETLPLGSGALAGNPFGVDRRAISLDLGFGGRVCPNSMDAVSDRDFVLDTLYFCAVTMVHLSRWAEDLIIYSSGAFG